MREELRSAIEENRLSHAYLFDSSAEAEEFAYALNAHPVDFIRIAPPEGKMHIPSEDIENLRDELNYKSYGDRRVVLIEHADLMQQTAQNKLLKTLEEPLGNTVLILSCETGESLLPTIISRCICIASADSEYEFGSDAARLAKEFYGLKKKGGQYFELKALLSDMINDKDSARENSLAFLDALESLMREDLIKSLDAGRLSKEIKLVEETRNNIKASYSLAYAMKALALNL
ncbi:MAG: hypothetical protein IKX96_05175 [Firmicutes bacterium]|nr:hypothetical protein [Bacillota bacterium]